MKSGFTLVELLTVVAIIAILTASAIAAYTMASKKARDGKRKADIEAIRSALEMYRADTGVYPGTVTSGDSINDGGSPVSTYMNSVPFDPKSPGYHYRYAVGGGNSTYCLGARLEGETSTCDCSGITSNCTSIEGCNYCLANP